MITEYEVKVLQINKPLRGLQKGTNKKIKVDKHGTPLDKYWRDRFKDAKHDNCVEFVKSKTRNVRKEIKKIEKD